MSNKSPEADNNHNGTFPINDLTNPTNARNKKLFPQKLWELINDEKYNFCLRWSEDGQLVYLNRDEFEEYYLKTNENQFHTQKAISFVRQMNMYGFRKVDDFYYENDNFKRDSEHLLKNMIRKHPNKANPLINGNDDKSDESFSTFLYGPKPTSIIQQNAPVSLLAPSHRAMSHTPISTPTNFPDFRQSPQVNYQFDSFFNNPKTNEVFDSLTRNGRISDQSQDVNCRHMIDTELTSDNSLTSSGEFCCSGSSTPHNSLPNLLADNLNTPAATQAATSNGKSITDPGNSTINDLIPTQTQQLAFFQQLGPSFLDTISRFPSLGKSNTPNDDARSSRASSATNKSHVGQNDYNPFTKTFSTETPMNSRNENMCNIQNLHSQHQSSSSSGIRNEQDLLQAILSQQPYSQFPLVNTQNSNLQPANDDNLNAQLENSNLNAFFALLSTINQQQSMYQPAPQSPLQATNNQNLSLDIVNKFANLQQIYHQIILQQQQNQVTDLKSDSTTSGSELNMSTRKSAKLNDVQQISNESKRACPDTASQSNPRFTDTSPCQLIRSNGFNDNLNQYERHNTVISPKFGPQDMETNAKRKEQKFGGRQFKRSVDSILGSNDNQNDDHREPDTSKKAKTESKYKRDIASDEKKLICYYAKNLVIQMALARNARVETRVIQEAARYTEKFVETLFDTAQLIARHSRGSSSDSLLAIDGQLPSTAIDDSSLRVDKDLDKPNISLTNLASALKVMPTKLPKMMS